MKTFLFSFLFLLFFSVPHQTIGQDTLINFDDVEFSDGQSSESTVAEEADTTGLVNFDEYFPTVWIPQGRILAWKLQ